MRDIVLTAILFGAIPFILRRPTLGALLWVWVSVMSPHRLTWGFAYNLPFAQSIAIATLVGIFFSREPKKLPLTPVVVVLLLLTLWINVTTLTAFDPEMSTRMLEKVMKTLFMVFIVLYLLHTKQHVQLLVWILALSVGYFGTKGGLFTLRGGGQERVFGPEGSFIEENNALALATLMTIPLLRYLHLQATNKWVRRGLLAAMVLCFFSALGSQSRGALVAICAMVGVLWIKSRNKVMTAIVLAVLVPTAIAFMPDTWDTRMKTIETYEEDDSAMGRINAWRMAINLAADRPLVGGGFEIYNPTTFARYAPNPIDIHAAHSIYFQMLGEHGYIGLGLFVLLLFLLWRECSWLIAHSRNRPELLWASDLGRMVHVSLIGYAVGGAFLNLAYYDVPYYMLVAVVLTRALVEKEIKGTEQQGWFPPRPQPGAPGQGNAVLDARVLPQRTGGPPPRL